MQDATTPAKEFTAGELHGNTAQVDAAPAEAGAIPYNPVTGQPYRGEAVQILRKASLRNGYTDLRWMPFVQAAENNWRVRKGETATRIPVYLSQQDETIPFPVFNAEQIKGIPPDYGTGSSPAGPAPCGEGPKFYKGLRFRSHLEATWAAFFDLAGWKWEYSPGDVSTKTGWCSPREKPLCHVIWRPDFLVSFACGHSECPATHELYVRVEPYTSISQFQGHPVGKLQFAGYTDILPAMFGAHPRVTQWEMCHGAGGGLFSVDGWVNSDCDALWIEAGTMTRRHA